MTDRDRTRRRALGALAAVVALALGVGVVLAAGAYAAARMVGLTDDGGHQTAHVATAPSRTRPSSTPTSTPSSTPSAGASPSGTASAPASPPSSGPSPAGQHQDAATQATSQSRTRRHQAHRHAQHRADRRQHRHRRARHHHHRHQRAVGTVTLHASRTRVRPMGRVDLGGRCGCRSGTTLVVQRLEHGHWARFPATATASRGRFRTWVMTGRHGANRFRVVAPGGAASNPVTIMVG